MKFTDLIGQEIAVLYPRLHATEPQRVKLVGVEPSGIWVESEAITNLALQAFNISTAPKTLVFFLPYDAIAFAVAAAEGPSLNEKAFGT